MTDALEYRFLTEGMDAEADACAAVLHASFNTGVEASSAWVARATLPKMRAVTRGDEIVGCLNVFDMGHWFGGRSVTSGAISAVGVAPTERGRGVAKALMTNVLRELAARRVAVSTLYPASWGLYRAVGYELTGVRMEISVPVSRLERRRPTRAVRPLVESDMPAVEDCHRAYASARDGSLDRAPENWQRARMPRGEMTHGAVFEGDDGLDAYVMWRMSESPDEHAMYHVNVTDVAVRHPGVTADVLAFLARTSSLGDRLVFFGGVDHPFCPLLPDRYYTSSLNAEWMIRIVDVERAFTQRAYPAHVDVSVSFDLRDELLPDNAGTWTLTIRDGEAQVARGGDGALSLDVRALAALYTGHLRPDALVALGIADDHADLPRLADALAVRAPSISEMF